MNLPEISNSGAASVVQSGSLHIAAPPEETFPLFSAPGEKLWVDGWDPVVLSGDGLERGTVFITDVDEKTFWIVVDYDRDARHVRLARVAPKSRAGTVDVRVESDGGKGSLVTVTYELTSLSERGDVMLAELDQDGYETMMRGWEQAIRDAAIDYEQVVGN